MQASGFLELLRRSQSGDHGATAQILTAIRPYLSKVAAGCIDASRASRSVSDLVQEAEIRVWRSLGQFRGAETDEDSWAMFRTWMAQIVRRLGRDLDRDRNAHKRSPGGRRIVPLEAARAGSNSDSRLPDDPPAAGSTVSARLCGRERADQVRRAIGRLLDDKDRAIVEDFFFKGASLRQIAASRAWPYHEVKQRYHDSMRRLESDLSSL